MSELNELIARVEALSGADREMDAALMALTYARDERHIGTQEGSDFGGWEPVKDSVWVDPNTDKWVSTAPFSYTSSIDAALAFAERVLPGGTNIMLKLQTKGKYYHAEFEDIEFESGDVEDISAYNLPTLPLAIILATLKAKAEE